MKKKTFKSEVLSGHKENALEVPFNPGETWNMKPSHLWRGRNGYQVIVKLNGVSFESCIVGRQKKFFVVVDKDMMHAAELAVGDTVTATVAPQVQ